MQKINMQEVKTIEFEMLQYVKYICEKNNIKYYLGYGTLLGAVRHNGFIPWDDDVDVVLFRDEYNKLIDAIEEDNHDYLKVLHMKNSNAFFGPYSLLVDTRTFMKHYKIKKDVIDGMGVCIDIFPLDYFSNLKNAQKALSCSKFLKALNNLTMVSTFQYDRGLKGIAKRFMAPLANMLGHRRLCEMIERLANCANRGECNYVADLMWDPQMRWCIPSEAYNDVIMLEFEEDKFSAPKNYDMILKAGYGHYMQFPPENERNTGHDNVFYWKQ